MTGRINPKGLFSLQESDFLQRYSTRIYGAITEDKVTDTRTKNYILQRTRSTISQSLVDVFNEGIALRMFLEREAPDEANDIAKWIGDMEEDDGLLSEFIKAWVPEDRFELFLNQLLLPDEMYPATLSLSRWSTLLRVLHQHVENTPMGDLVPENREAILASLTGLERMLEPIEDEDLDETDGCGIRGEEKGAYGKDEDPPKGELEAIRWLRDGDKSKCLTISSVFQVEGHPGVQIRVKWEYNIPSLLLISLAHGFPTDYESLSSPLERASWSTIIDLIIDRFNAFGLAVISEDQCSVRHPRYWLDPMEIQIPDRNKDQPYDLVEMGRRDEVISAWKEQFSNLTETEPISVVSLVKMPQQIRDKVTGRKGGGGKKSAFSAAVNQMIRMGLVEAVSGSRRRMVRITDLGCRVADFLVENKMEDGKRVVKRCTCTMVLDEDIDLTTS